MLMVLAPAPGKKTRAQSKKEDAEAPATGQSGPDESGASENSSEALES